MGKSTTFTKEDALYILEKDQSPRRNKKSSFEIVKRYIQGCPATRDPLTRIIIEEDNIYFGHNFLEIDSSFPDLKKLILRQNKPLTEVNIKEYSQLSDCRLIVETPLDVRQEELKKRAEAYFKNHIKKEYSKTSIEIKDPNEQLLDLVRTNNTVVIGETPYHKSSKKILIDNMAALAKAGVKTIYLEHVFNHTQLESFNHYFSDDGLMMPRMLEDYLLTRDIGFKLQRDEFEPYTFTGLVVQAKRQGIKIVPIDAISSYSMTNFDTISTAKDAAGRCLMMNFIADRVFRIEDEPGEKSIFLVSSAHINAVNSGVPGIAEITGGPTLVIEDLCENPVKASTHDAKPNFLFYLDSCSSEEANKLKEEYTQALIQRNDESIHNTDTSNSNPAIQDKESIADRTSSPQNQINATISSDNLNPHGDVNNCINEEFVKTEEDYNNFFSDLFEQIPPKNEHYTSLIDQSTDLTQLIEKFEVNAEQNNNIDKSSCLQFINALYELNKESTHLSLDDKEQLLESVTNLLNEIDIANLKPRTIPQQQHVSAFNQFEQRWLNSNKYPMSLLKAIAVIICAGIGLLCGAALFTGFAVATGLWTGPAAAVVGLIGLVHGSITGAALELATASVVAGVIAGVSSSYCFFKPSSFEHCISDVVNKARKLVETPAQGALPEDNTYTTNKFN